MQIICEKNICQKKSNKYNEVIPNLIWNLPHKPFMDKQQTAWVEDRVKDPGQKPSGMTLGNRGFPLIELLVVVLIIGILAAVALPQYQKAVQKARLTEVFLNIKAIRTALESYKLANGSYTYDFTQLDIDFPGAQYGESEGIANSKITLPNGNLYFLDADGYIDTSIPNMPARLNYWWDPISMPAGIYCRARAPKSDSSHPGHKLCESLGGVYKKDMSGHAFYLLP